MKLLLATMMAVAPLLVSCAAPDSAPAAADTVLLNGRVYSFSWEEPASDGTPAANAPHTEAGWQPDAEAIAVRDGLIVFVGSNRQAETFLGPATQRLDLNGATVLPGLVDSHVHVAELGEAMTRVNLVDVSTEEEAVDRVVQRAREVPEGEWIAGWGWDEGAWADRYPDSGLLSERVPNHPVYLKGLHGFAVWGNRLALQKAGIDSETPTPFGGEILKDSAGRPTGVFLNRARALLEDAVPARTPEQLRDRVAAGLRAMAESGFVAIHEAGAGADLIDAFSSLEGSEDLSLRTYAMLSARDEELLESWIARGPDREGMLTVRSVKAYYDGALGSRGARLIEAYTDRPGHFGTSGSEYGFEEALVARAMKAGFQVGVHAIGDSGNRATLDFFQAVFEGAPSTRENRHRIEHAQVVHPDDIARLAELSLIASMQPPHAVEDKTWAEDRLGPERIKGAYAWRTLRTTGARLIFNSDLAGSDHSIFYGLHAAITRRDKKGQPAGGWYPEEGLTAEESIRAYTVWPAYAGFVESETGVLAPGKWADITVLDIDPLSLSQSAPDRILQGSILATMVGGELVYTNLE